MKLAVALVVIAIVVLGALLLRTTRGPLPSLEGPGPNNDSAAAHSVAHRQAVASAPVTGAKDEPARTLRSYLSEYWGPRWKEIEASLLEQGIDLDQPFTPEPWESVAPTVERMVFEDEVRRQANRDLIVQWPGDIHSDAGMLALRAALEIPDDVVLEAADALAIESECVSYNEQLGVLADEYNRKLEFHLREVWNSGAFVKAPFTTRGLSTGGFFYSAAVGSGSWGVTIGLRKEDCPDLFSLKEEAAALRARRNRAVRDYLDNRGY